jgi:[ribosomal protein S5]-alanine N-acetyltransferase
MEHYCTGPETKRLQHRAFTVDDAEAFFAINSNPDVMRFTGEPILPSLDAARQAIANYPDFDKLGYGRWASVLKETQTIIGFCGLKYLSDLDAVDVGFRFLPRYWGRGLATEACVASLDFGFTTLSLDQIVGFVVPENIASIRVLEKAGMQLDGEFDYDGTLALRHVKRRQLPANNCVNRSGDSHPIQMDS